MLLPCGRITLPLWLSSLCACHRYPSTVLFLAVSVWPVYCSFCTRSYAVGADVESCAPKASVAPARSRFERVFEYLRQRPEVEDVVLSGGDASILAPRVLENTGRTLLDIPHIQRLRVATKCLSVLPMKITGDAEWTQSIINLHRHAHGLRKQFAVHTHLNHEAEFTDVTQRAMDLLKDHGVTVRNQATLLRTVNDTPEAIRGLLQSLARVRIDPYYVYQCDMAQGLEYFRTPLSSILNIERQLRGAVSGFLMPQFVVDLPGGGGKRLAATFDAYDPASGVSRFASPAVGGDRAYFYHDPRPGVA